MSSARPSVAPARPAIDIVDRAPATLAALIESVTFGSAGLRYRRLDVVSQLARLHDPVYALARDGERLVGACALDRRALLVGGRETRGVYRGSLCVAPDRAGRGIGHALAEAARRWIDAEAREHGTSILSWGCIERDNHPSLAVLRASGAHDAGGLAMMMLYRQWPRERVALESLAAGRDPRERAALAATHADAATRDVTPSPLPGFALSDGAGVRVSARVATSGYRIETMGATTDTLVRALVIPFPMARRRFDPARFRYLRLADVALRDGCERDWRGFVTTLLARHDAHFATVFVDPDSALGARLRRAGRFGAFASAWGRVPQASLRVVARWSGGGTPSSVGRLPNGAQALAPVDG